MNETAKAIIVVIALLVIGGWVGWTAKGIVVENPLRDDLARMAQLLEDSKKITVDQTIRTLEISLRGDNIEFITQALEMAKEASSKADGYGEERIREIERELEK